jgi:hypothetical protein
VLKRDSTEPPTKNKESKLKTTNGEQDLSQNQKGLGSISCTAFYKTDEIKCSQLQSLTL